MTFPEPGDFAAVRALLDQSVPVSYRASIRPHLEQALRAPEGEEQLLLAHDRPGGAITGFVLFGIVPGTRGAGRVRAVAVAPLARRRGVGRALLRSACARLIAQHARFALAELPDEEQARFLWALLEAEGFAEEARAADLVRAGVAMRYVRKPLT